MPDPKARRFAQTLEFVQTCAGPPPLHILDLGVRNPLAERLESLGYQVTSTQGEDLDLDTSAVRHDGYDLVTAFEVLEHTVSPFPLLKDIRAPKLIATVPLRLWFARAYWSEADPRDRHFHEFEDRQFDMLLEKAGWKIKHTDKWVSPATSFGLRSLLRAVTPRFYAVYAERP